MTSKGASWQLGVTAVMAGMAAIGCARRPTPPAEITAPAAIGEESEVGPRLSEAADWPAPEGSAQAAQALPSEDGISPSGVWRADGRPAWWFEGAVLEDGRVVVAAESMARDVVSARRQAVEQGRAALRRASGTGDDERVEATLVKRLQGDGPGRDRFVGYVRMSWRPSGGE